MKASDTDSSLLLSKTNQLASNATAKPEPAPVEVATLGQPVGHDHWISAGEQHG
jgi:hypothetical protein